MEKNNKTICFVIHSLQAGGMERVMSELAIQFAERSYIKLHIVLYGVKRDIFYSIPSNVIIHKPSFKFDSSKRLISTVRTFFFLRKKLRSLNADTILSFGEYWNSFVLLSCIGLRLPVYISDRCQPDKYFGKKQEWLRRWLYPKAAGIIAQTSIAKDIYLRTIKQHNIQVIGNPIPEIENDSSISKEDIVLSVGRLIDTKHHDKLIELFVKIGAPGWKLVIVGDDAIKQNNMVRLKDLVNHLNANGKVILTGSQSDVRTHYLKSKIFAFTSSSEGFPNVIGEAQAAGLPVVAFDCVAGPAEMIKDGENGFLVPLFDYTLFEKRLSQLMYDNDLQKRLGENATRSIKKFSANHISTLYEKFILKQL